MKKKKKQLQLQNRNIYKRINKKLKLGLLVYIFYKLGWSYHN